MFIQPSAIIASCTLDQTSNLRFSVILMPCQHSLPGTYINAHSFGVNRSDNKLSLCLRALRVLT